MSLDGRSEYPNLVAIYWKGLPMNQDWLRVDVERHFEVIPRQHLRDVVAVRRPVPNQKTIQYAIDAYESPKLHAHKEIEHKVYLDHVKPNVHHLPDATSS